jgi:cobalt-zinc-cadmium efflux system membrane fusion protein
MFEYKIPLIIIFGFLAIACNDKKEEHATPSQMPKEEELVTFVELTKEQFETFDIEFGKVEEMNLSTTIKASGHLEVPPQNKAEVSSYVGAVVKFISVLEGSKVQKGQTLAILEHPDFIKLQQEYVDTKNSLSYLQKEYERQKELADNDAGTGKMYQRAENEYNGGKARLNSLVSQLKVLNVNINQLNRGKITASIILKSPITGYVGHIKANTGAYAEPNTPLFEIIDNSQIHCDLLVYEKDIFKVKEGQKIHFTITNMPDHQGDHEGKPIEGEIFGIDKSFEGASKAITVHAKIKNESHALIPGMYVNALIDVGQNRTKAVASDAIFTTDGKQFVFIRNKMTGCKIHKDCAAHEFCAPSENCSEHPKCELHEHSPFDKVCSKHPECEAHEKCKAIEHSDAYYFTMKEIKKGITDLGFTAISFIDDVPNDATIVTKGAFYLFSKSKTSGQMDACGH